MAIVVHNYRWRLGLADGEARYDALEATLGATPPIRVPAITLEGDANGAPTSRPRPMPAKFAGPYEHRNLGRRHRPQPAAGSARGVREGRDRRGPALRKA